MARPLSEEKKQALLTAATHAIAQLGISASTAIIAKKAEVAEGTLFRYFPTKDALFNALYLHLKKSLCSAIMNELVVDSDPKQQMQNIWNSYINWGARNSDANRTIRLLIVSDKISQEVQDEVNIMFPELYEISRKSMCHKFQNAGFSSFSDALFFSLAETTIEFSIKEPSKAKTFKEVGFQAIWHALNADV